MAGSTNIGPEKLARDKEILSRNYLQAVNALEKLDDELSRWTTAGAIPVERLRGIIADADVLPFLKQN